MCSSSPDRENPGEPAKGFHLNSEKNKQTNTQTKKNPITVYKSTGQ